MKFCIHATTFWFEFEANCGRITLNDDAYYCNKELVQLVIFEAKVTNSSYGEWKFKDDEEKTLIERYNASLRFVATMSGLTRWQFIYGEVEVETDFEFGDYHTRAVDETWYKSAILQHRIDPDSFVYSVPHANDPLEGPELKVTASHAIFPRDGGMEAPACVVGFQFPHVKMWERFANITSEENVSQEINVKLILLHIHSIFSAMGVLRLVMQTTMNAMFSTTMPMF